MSRRPLSPAEAELWRRVVATVEPLERGPGKKVAIAVAGPEPAQPAPKPAPAKPKGRLPAPRPAVAARPEPKSALRPGAEHGGHLDGGWDRRLAKGSVAPDVTIDLHGHNLDTAYQRLDHALALAIAAGHRLVLLVTGKPRPDVRPGEPGKPVRGAIRAVVTDWLAASRHAGSIAAVRRAHPKHGGQGALYIVLRRRR